MIKTDWDSWANTDKCPLCGEEGEKIANVYKKGHCRANGIILETGLSYCKKCSKTPECETHWNNWWAEQWKKQEEFCEDNWEKYGVYTNVVGWLSVPSTYFGYVKTEDGLKPYRIVYPNCPRIKLEKLLATILYDSKKLGVNECKRKAIDLLKNSATDQKYKDSVETKINEFLEEDKC